MTRTNTFLALALALAGGTVAFAQSNPVPGPADYARFSQFITQRNIFDPNRYALTARPVYTPPARPQFTPTFTLVGTMSYDKGVFAFFDGNQSDLRKVLYPTDTNGIAGFTLAEITLSSVKLQTADKKQIVEMKIGQSMQQAGNSWQLASEGGYSSSGNSGYGDGNNGYGGRNRGDRSFGGRNRNFGNYGGDANAAPAADSSSPDTSAAPSSALEGNDVLKKLMQQREQELK